MIEMFTGIITDIGSVTELNDIGADRRIHVHTSLPANRGLKSGDSIAVNGVCLTITDFTPVGFSADISAETLRCTTFATLQPDDAVNLEPALISAAPMGGHMVSGHVDGVGTVESIKAEGRSYCFVFSMPESLSRYIAVKGAITIDGVSLTVNTVNRQSFSVNIIPHTLEQTIFKRYQPGTAVNLEVDLLARYLERLLESRGV
ncbi:MAG TPA: riboflavin synthase [Gammaproteobacteria bacterium]